MKTSDDEIPLRDTEGDTTAILAVENDAFTMGRALGATRDRPSEMRPEDYREQQWRVFAAGFTFTNRDRAYKAFARGFANGYDVGEAGG